MKMLGCPGYMFLPVSLLRVAFVRELLGIALALVCTTCSVEGLRLFFHSWWQRDLLKGTFIEDVKMNWTIALAILVGGNSSVHGIVLIQTTPPTSNRVDCFGVYINTSCYMELNDSIPRATRQANHSFIEPVSTLCARLETDLAAKVLYHTVCLFFVWGLRTVLTCGCAQ